MALIQWKQISPHLSGSANLTGSLNVSGSLSLNGTDVSNFASLTEENTFTGTQIISGSLFHRGYASFQQYPWPQPGYDEHFIETEPFEVEVSGYPSRSYEYMAVALQHNELDPLWGQSYHNSFTVYAYDSHELQTYGTELNISPLRNHMRIFASGSLSAANISVADLTDGRTQGLFYGDILQIGVVRGSNILIGNTSASVGITGSVGVKGNLDVDGILTAREYHTELVSASIIYQSGSTQFGNSADDIHAFFGSLNPTGSIIPQVDTTGTGKWNLGSLSNPWHSLYVSTGSIYFVDNGDIVHTLSPESVISIFKQTGSFWATSNDVQITGSLTIADGLLKLKEYTTPPVAESGAIYYSASNFYFGIG